MYKIISALLGLEFVLAVLKINQVIHWSWLWVTLPLWGPVLIALDIIIIVMALMWLLNREINKANKYLG